MTRQGWRPARSRSGPPFAILGVLLTLIVLLVIGILLVLNGQSGNVAPTASPSTAASQAAVASTEPTATLEIPVATPTAEVTPEPTPEVTAPPTSTPTLGPSLAPGQTPKPTLTGFTAPTTASCTATNGVAPIGYIHLTWTASDTTGVRISIDPPAANTAYAYGYADYPWPAVTSADVPFACGSASHLYVITTAHTTGYFQYRFKKVTAIP